MPHNPSLIGVRFTCQSSPIAYWAGSLFLAGILTTFAAFALLTWPVGRQVGTCQSPPIRREWRALLPDERKQFTDAVTCLSKVTSHWGLNGTLYDDFAILHEQI